MDGRPSTCEKLHKKQLQISSLFLSVVTTALKTECQSSKLKPSNNIFGHTILNSAEINLGHLLVLAKLSWCLVRYRKKEKLPTKRRRISFSISQLTRDISPATVANSKTKWKWQHQSPHVIAWKVLWIGLNFVTVNTVWTNLKTWIKLELFLFLGLQAFTLFYNNKTFEQKVRPYE